MLGGRPVTMVLREALAPRNYVAAARMPFVVRRPLDFARRYYLGAGEYPHECTVRTPLGPLSLTLYSHHDAWTVNEVFARQDYRTGAGVETVVDIGSNIGVSGAYFLTRNSDSRVFLYEPEPTNVERLRRNLAPFEGRWALEEGAVAPEGGVASFGREASGRYGGIGLLREESIQVRVVGVNDVLAAVIAQRSRIDVLKLDTEGLEAETVGAIRADLLESIETIYFESERREHLHPDQFSCAFVNQTVRLTRRGAVARR